MRNISRSRGRSSALLAAALLFLCLAPGLTVLAAEAGNTDPPPGETAACTETIPISTVPGPSTEPEASLPAEATEAMEPTGAAEATEATEADGAAESAEFAGTEAPEAALDGPAPAVTALEGEEEAMADTLWYSVSPEDILPTDILAVTITQGPQTWALSSENGSLHAPAATAVLLENGVMRSQGPALRWKLEKTDAGLCLRPENAQTRLYTDNGSDALRIGELGDPYWILSQETLFHPYTGRYLRVDPERGIWQAVPEYPEDQTLAFWRQARTAPVTAQPSGGVLNDGQMVTLSCSDPAADIWYALSSDGEAYSGFQPFTGPIAMDAEASALYVKAYTLSADSPASPEAVFAYTRAPTAASKPDWALPFQFYFGQLHSHTVLSDGVASLEDTFRYAAGVEGLDFFAVTDHSDSFQNSSLGSIARDGSTVSADWAAGKAAASAVTSETFVGLFGYEMSWPEGKNLGHIGTFATPGWQSWKQADFSSLERYYQALNTVPEAVGQFNHPGEFYGCFADFSNRTAAYDQNMALLEVGGEGDFRAYAAYDQALDAGWHVAPTSSLASRLSGWSDTARTVLLAPALTESALYDAMRGRRAYATDDSDLEVYFTLNGAPMGSILPIQEDCTVSAYLYDPTDSALGLVEVITDGGQVAASQRVEAAWAQLSIQVPGGYDHYYLRITQADGDVAVTAPVWVDSFQDMGIQSFAADTALAVQGQELRLTVTLFNEETVPFQVSAVALYAGNELVYTMTEPGTVAPAATLELPLSYTHQSPGIISLRVQVTGSVNGQPRSYEKTLSAGAHAPQQVGDILIGGSQDALARFTSIAGEADMRTTVFSGDFPSGGKLLLVTQPQGMLERGFTENVKRFLAGGGSLIVLGQAGADQALNGLLADIGSTLRFGGAVSDLDGPGFYNSDAAWCEPLDPESFFYFHGGCAVLPGSGTWLVKAPGTGSVLLAWEETPYGGSVFAAGSPFLTDTEMPVPKSKWDPASANQQLLESILGAHRQTLPLHTVREAREGQAGELFRIQGYATTGTSNPHTTFPGTLCIQDASGGIPVTDFTASGIPVGTPLEIVGYRQEDGGNAVLSLIDFQILEVAPYRCVPKTLSCADAMDYAAHGGELVQVEATTIAVEYTADGKGVSRLTLQDKRGGVAVVIIGDNIHSGSRRTNTLAAHIKPGRIVRAMGILYLEAGAGVLRARNCDEVVYVPPIPPRGNPRTGDGILAAFPLLLSSGGALAAVAWVRKRKRGHGCR